MKKYILVLFAGLLLCSCDVDVQNPNKIDQTDYWQTPEHALNGVNAIYNMFYKPGTYTRWWWFRTDLTSDEGFSSSPWAELREWCEFNYINYNFWEGNGWTYRDCYEAIFRANQVLTYIEDIEFDDAGYKNELIAQAYFLRGLFYHNLALLWGSTTKSLAIVLEPSTPDMQPEGHTGAEVYQQAIDDFTSALDYNIPEEWNENEKGRATKGAALAMRAKCYMQTHRWAEARADLQWLVEGDGRKYYDLMPDYHANFDKDHENNRESVFELQYSDVNPDPAGDGDFDTNPNLGQNRGQFFAPPGVGWTDGELRPWLVDEFKKELNNDDEYDIRLKWTCMYEGMENDFPDNSRIYGLTSSPELWSEQNWKGRVWFRKYSAECFRDYDDYYNPINIRLIRFADVLLMYAECIVQSGGSLADAVGYVNDIRARVNMPPLATNHPQAASDPAEFLKRLQMERVMELSTEGHRWADLKRWGLLDTEAGLSELRTRDADFNNFQIGKHDVLPIPSSETINNPNIEQNPNY